MTVPAVEAPTELDPNSSKEAAAGKSKKGGKKAKGGKGDAKTASSASGDSKGSAAAEAKKKEPKPGRLTINCRPACDAIIAGGTALGPSPVFSHQMPPGQHRVTCKGNSKSKTIVVRITSGQLTTTTCSMK